MTNEEAIFIIEHRDSIMDYCESKQLGEALDMAIAALKAEPCGDAVSREAMLNGLASIAKAKAKSDAQKSLMGRIMFFTEQLPPVTPKQRWIPVSERLPENRNLVLVTTYWHETYQVMVGSYWGNGVWWCAPWNNTSREHLKMLNAVAWMPLPEPYKEGESE